MHRFAVKYLLIVYIRSDAAIPLPTAGNAAGT